MNFRSCVWNATRGKHTKVWFIGRTNNGWAYEKCSGQAFIHNAHKQDYGTICLCATGLQILTVHRSHSESEKISDADAVLHDLGRAIFQRGDQSHTMGGAFVPFIQMPLAVNLIGKNQRPNVER